MKKPIEPVSVVINVFNEAATVEAEIRALHSKIVDAIPGSELIVAEDGSFDGTKDIVRRLKDELGIVLSTASHRKGYAQALRDAFLLARCPYIFFSDTGNKHNPQDFWKLYPFRKDHGIVIGVKTNRSDQFYRQLLTKGYNKLVSLYFNVNIHDIDSGFRIYQRSVVDKIFSEDWIYKELIASEITLRAIYSGFTVKEVPIEYSKREGTSRGLPPKKIARVVVRTLRNFPLLRETLSAPHYASTEAVSDSIDMQKQC
jgi:glycosyltransferase involved in cell wall biosynthesis